MDCAFSNNRVDDFTIADGLGANFAVVYEALRAGLNPVTAFDLDDRRQNRSNPVFGDVDQFCRERAHLRFAASSSRSFHHGSIKTFMIPPHTAGLSDEISSRRSIRTIRGSRVRITSIASRFTSASPHPPPIVPSISPQAVTTIFAPTSRGVDPLVETMVASARVSPLLRNSLTWWYTESCFFS